MQISIAKPPQFEWFETVAINTLEEMSELCLENNFSPAIFKDGKRKLDNFKIAHCIGLDIDNDGKSMPGTDIPTPLMTLEEAKEVFKEYTHLILPSRSHQKLKDGRVLDRFRIILFFTEPITDIDTFYATWAWCKAKWPPIDHQCKDPSRGYYKHSAIASLRKLGLRIQPVPPKPKEFKEKVEPTPGQKGTLSRTTLEFLLKGAQPGNRNGDTFKAAKEFQQNLYSEEEAVDKIITALNQNETIDRDFNEQEATATIRSAYSKDAKHEPRIKPRAFNLLPVGQLFKQKSHVDWLCDGLLSVGGLSLVSSDPKAGKSTLVRQLMRDVLRGENFLGRKCKRGTVHYYGIEEQVEVVNSSFKRLGITEKDDLLVHVGDLLCDNPMQDFYEILMELKPTLAVIDTLFDFLDVESENNYKEVKRELRRLRKIARETGTHIMVIHHNSKGQKDDKRRGNRGILGSQAIAGGMDTILVIEVDGRKRLISTSGREVKTWTNREIVFNDLTRTYTLGSESDDEY